MDMNITKGERGERGVFSFRFQIICTCWTGWVESQLTPRLQPSLKWNSLSSGWNSRNGMLLQKWEKWHKITPPENKLRLRFMRRRVPVFCSFIGYIHSTYCNWLLTLEKGYIHCFKRDWLISQHCKTLEWIYHNLSHASINSEESYNKGNQIKKT